MLKGKLSDFSIISILKAINKQKRTGILTIKLPIYEEIFIYFDEGDVIDLSAKKEDYNLDKFLLKNGLISDSLLERIKLKAQEETKPITAILLKMNYISPKLDSEIIEKFFKNIFQIIIEAKEGEFIFEQNNYKTKNKKIFCIEKILPEHFKENNFQDNKKNNSIEKIALSPEKIDRFWLTERSLLRKIFKKPAMILEDETLSTEDNKIIFFKYLFSNNNEETCIKFKNIIKELIKIKKQLPYFILPLEKEHLHKKLKNTIKELETIDYNSLSLRIPNYIEEKFIDLKNKSKKLNEINKYYFLSNSSDIEELYLELKSVIKKLDTVGKEFLREYISFNNKHESKLREIESTINSLIKIESKFNFIHLSILDKYTNKDTKKPPFS